MAKSELHSALLEGSEIGRQVDLEQEYRDEGINLYQEMRRRSESKGDAAMLKPGEIMLGHWFGPLESSIGIARENMLKTGSGPSAVVLSPCLRLIEADLLAVLTVREVLGRFLSDHSARHGVKLLSACYAVGRAAFAEINFEAINKEQPGVAWILTERVRRLDASQVQWWANRSLDDPMNERRVAIALGAFLIEHLMEAAYIGPVFESDRAFGLRMKVDGKRRNKMLVMHSEVYRLIDEGHFMRQILRPRFGPMVVQPYPWSKELEGGYAKLRTPFISKLTNRQRDAIREPGTDLVYEGVNALSAVGMSIDQRILDVAQAVWSRGGGRLSMPPRDQLPFPPFPPKYRPDGSTGSERWSQCSDEEKQSWKEAARQRRRDERDLAGQRTETAGILDLATRFGDEDAIYFPHQLDFRGRAYPLPVHLNHQGSDLCRGLLRFANPVKLGNDGMYWLCVHAANCYGVDKVPFDSRVEWVQQHADDISRAVSDPHRDEFWKSADDPWQFLAACYALDDTDAGEKIPVHFDGSNNGLQWYGAMTKDEIGGALVNLIPGDSPADGYMDVCNAARDAVGLDAEAHPDAIEWLIRDVVKQPVMTQTYGVTGYGARGQIRRKLGELGVEEGKAKDIAKYLAAKIEEGIGDKFPGAKTAMAWLKASATAIADSGEFLRWTSPIGMPVIQDGFNYCNQGKTGSYVTTTLGRIRVAKADAPPKRCKQISGAAPNFVHSIDSSHMMMTAICMRDEHMDFKGVHDSFGMHAGCSSRGRQIINEQFVLLAKSDILGALHAEWVAKYPEVVMPDLPEYGNLDLDEIEQSQYLFS